DGVKRVVIAIGPRKDHHSKFHDVPPVSMNGKVNFSTSTRSRCRAGNPRRDPRSRRRQDRFSLFTLRLPPRACLVAALLRRFPPAFTRGLFTCLPRAIPSASAGTLSVIAELAATYAPSPIFTGAIKMESLPMNTRFPIVVGYFAKPS